MSQLKMPLAGLFLREKTWGVVAHTHVPGTFPWPPCRGKEGTISNGRDFRKATIGDVSL